MSSRSVLRSHQPAHSWQDAYPLGNGKVGAMVYGRLAREKVLLNHESLWNGSAAPQMPDISTHLPELRCLLQQQQYRRAEDFLKGKWCEAGYSFGSKTPGTADLLASDGIPTQVGKYQPAADLLLEQDFEHGFRHYCRELDLRTGVARIAWDSRDGWYEREAFVSVADGVLVMRLRSGQGARINGRLGLQAHNADIRTSFGSDHPAPEDLDWECHAGGSVLTYRLKRAQQPDCEVQALCRVQGGECVQGDGHLLLRGVEEALILCRLAVGSQPSVNIESAGLPYCYETLKARHVEALGQRPYPTVFALGDSRREEPVTSCEAMLDAAYAADCPAKLWESCFDYGRYLLASSSRPGSLPANLQGIWNGDYEPAWWCGFFFNENLQMCYWPALRLGMAECLIPVFDFLETHLDDFRKNATRIYGCRGLLLPLFMDMESGLQKNNQSHVIHWTGAAAWLSQFYFDYWDHTRDEAFLRTRAYPFMLEALAFYQDFICEDASGGMLFAPSNSPENNPLGDFSGSGELSVSLNATADFALLKELLGNLLAVADLTGACEEQQADWKSLLARIPPYEINADGALCEWMHPDFSDNYRHRHLMHLYPLFPGREITRSTDPELFAACRVALEKRKVIGLQSQTGWSLAHMAMLYARLGEGDMALECLEMLARSCIGPNLLAYHNDWRHSGITMDYFGGWRVSPFQMDANAGITNAVLEMLVSARGDALHVLPALPSKWGSGRLTEVCLPACRSMDLCWDMAQRRIEITLRAGRIGGDIQLTVPDGFRPDRGVQSCFCESVASGAYRIAINAWECRTLCFEYAQAI